MQFTRRFKEKIRRGEQTLTFRRWKKPQARPGGVYRLHPEGGVRVSSVTRIEPGDITEDDARSAGHAGLDETLGFLGASDAPLYRVAFDYVAEADMPVAAPPPDDDIALRLARMDRRAGAPWTAAVLALIDEHPQRRAADLAAAMGWETAPFKANVRKLKALGLTRSLEVGYRLSETGSAVLAALRNDGV